MNKYLARFLLCVLFTANAAALACGDPFDLVFDTDSEKLATLERIEHARHGTGIYALRAQVLQALAASPDIMDRSAALLFSEPWICEQKAMVDRPALVRELLALDHPDALFTVAIACNDNSTDIEHACPDPGEMAARLTTVAPDNVYHWLERARIAANEKITDPALGYIRRAAEACDYYSAYMHFNRLSHHLLTRPVIPVEVIEDLREMIELSMWPEIAERSAEELVPSIQADPEMHLGRTPLVIHQQARMLAMFDATGWLYSEVRESKDEQLAKLSASIALTVFDQSKVKLSTDLSRALLERLGQLPENHPKLEKLKHLNTGLDYIEELVFLSKEPALMRDFYIRVAEMGEIDTYIWYLNHPVSKRD